MNKPDLSLKQDIIEILKKDFSGSDSNILSFSTLENISIQNGHANISLTTSKTKADQIDKIRSIAEQSIAKIAGLEKATITFTSHRTAPNSSAQTTNTGHRPLGGSRKSSSNSMPLLPHVKAVIAVASGKGGVGKSTTAVNLAVGLSQLGLKTGLLDADIYGPSLPHMLGKNVRPEVKDGRIYPIDAWNIKTMSIGYLVDEEQAMIWRGPMVMGALTQFLGEVEWGELDVLVIDMPPGTGDAQLTLTQKLNTHLKRGGAVIVSTPQDIALLDARRGVSLFERMGTPILGLVENMSYFCCPNCNHRTELFGHGGAKAEADKLHVPFLGEVPLLAEIRSSADAGTPIILSTPDSAAAQAYQKLSLTLSQSLQFSN
ncbi:Mrp/NBP35 family ATP-binding protein [Swingsia samuiensis]|uniref:Iron-sulfur cluster carrier protein n=1 Tax=Swingsia samuiensis TaxID=1293412 RepID=A0A4Y6UK78_9PROT|nr:Mrp/NBP35 family ATP-binding protein [Swingsia samuiensis]QDH17200.1 ATP-binding protein [Swingsia samuiensis]